MKHVEYSVCQVGDFFLTVVIINDCVIKRAEELRIVSRESAYLTRHARNELIVIPELPFLENERFVLDAANAHEVEQMAEQLAPLGHIQITVALFTTNQRCRMDCMVFGKSNLAHVFAQVGNLVVDILRLIMENQGDDIKGACFSQPPKSPDSSMNMLSSAN